MKKYIILLLPILVLLFGSVSMAYSQNDLTNLRASFRTKYNKDLSITCATQILDKWEQIKSTYQYAYIGTNNSTDFYSIFTNRQLTLNSNSVSVSGQQISNWFYSDSTNRTLTWTNGTMTINGLISLYVGEWDIFHQEDVDYDNTLFDPSVPYPDIITGSESVVLDLSSQGLGTIHGDVPRWAFLDNFSDYPETLRLYMSVKFWTPSGYEYWVDSDGFVNWKVNGGLIGSDTDYPVPYTTLYPMAHGLEIGFYTYQNHVMYNMLNSFINTIAPEYTGDTETIIHYSDGTDVTNDNTLSTKAFRHLPTSQGNRMSVKFCYYYVKNGRIYTGLWTTWDSYSPNTYNLQKIVNANINGSTAQVMPDQGEAQEQSDTPPANIPSGTNVNVTVNTGEQGVPNNMNYPTIVSYNHDNLFTTFVGTYNSAGQYLGDFGNFVQATFSWIPGQVWTLIIMGFGMALVIMILKII